MGGKRGEALRQWEGLSREAEPVEAQPRPCRGAVILSEAKDLIPGRSFATDAAHPNAQDDKPMDMTTQKVSPRESHSEASISASREE